MNIEISARTIIKVILIVVAVYCLYLLREVWAILFFAIIIASAVGPLATWGESKKIPRLLSVLVLYLLFTGAGIFLITLVIPILSYELNQLAKNLPQILESLNATASHVQGSRYGFIIENLENFLIGILQSLEISSKVLPNVISNVFGGVISFIAVVVLSFYLSVIRQGIPSFLKSVLPDAYEDYAIGLWRRTEIKIGHWFRGQLLLALSVGLVVFVGLSFMKIQYALLLGLVAVIFELVPIVGPVLFAIPGLILAFVQSPSLGLAVLVFYVVVQQLESHVLTPVILGKSLGLHPVTVIIALLIGGKLAGILGILLAVPAAVVLVEVWDDMAEQRQHKKPQSLAL